MSIPLSATKESKASLYRSSVLFYLACVRSILSYAVPVFHYSLSPHLKKDLELVQKRALSIIYPRLSYNDALDAGGIPTIQQYHDSICNTIFQSIANDKDHMYKLNKLLPQCKPNSNLLWKTRRFAVPRFKTDRFKNTFIIISSCINHK